MDWIEQLKQNKAPSPFPGKTITPTNYYSVENIKKSLNYECETSEI